MGISYLKIYLGIVFCMFFGLIIPAILMKGAVSFEMLPFYLITLYSSIRLALIITSTRMRMLEMTFFIFVYVFFGVAALSQVNLNEFPWGAGTYNTTSILNGAFIIMSGMAAYELGLFFNKIKSSDNVLKNYDVNLFLVVSVGLFSFIIGVIGKGGFQSLFLPRNELTALAQSLGVDTTIGLVFTVLVRIPIFVALMFAILLYIDKKKENLLSRSNFLLLLLIIILMILTLVANNPVSTARYWVGTIYIGLLFSVIKWNRFTQPIILLFITTVLLIVFPYADIFRNSLNIEITIRPLTEIMASKGDYDSFQQVMNIVDYTSYFGITYGMQFLGVLFFWVPRTIWFDKPIGSGATVAEGLGYQFTNVSAPLWSEFYINFGFLGLIILFFLYGWGSAKLQIKYEISKRNKMINFYRIFVPVFSAYQLFMLRGDLLSSFAYVAPIVLFIAVGLRAKRIKNIVLRKV
jgi:oligosaccharide repeat unit polymerase